MSYFAQDDGLWVGQGEGVTVWAVIGWRLGCGGWGLGFDVGVELAGLFPERGFGAFFGFVDVRLDGSRV